MTGSSTDAFGRIVASLDDAMFVVSAAAAGDADACLVGFATQCSIDPPRFLVCLSKRNRTYELATRARVLVVHRLRDDQHALAELLGGRSAHDDPDKLATIGWTPGPGGAPVIDDSDWFAGSVLDRLDVGDHVAFVLAPTAGRGDGATPLGFQHARDIDAGQEAG